MEKLFFCKKMKFKLLSVFFLFQIYITTAEAKESNLLKIKEQIETTWYEDSSKLFRLISELKRIKLNNDNYLDYLSSSERLIDYYNITNQIDKRKKVFIELYKISNRFKNVDLCKSYYIRLILSDPINSEKNLKKIEFITNWLKLNDQKKFPIAAFYANYELAVQLSERNFDGEKSLYYAEKACRIAKQNNLNFEYVLALKEQSATEKYLGLNEISKRHFQFCLWKCKKESKYNYLKILITGNLINACVVCKDELLAKYYAKQCVFYCKKYRCTSRIPAVYIELAYLHFGKMEFNKCIDLCRIANKEMDSSNRYIKEKRSLISLMGRSAVFLEKRSLADSCAKELMRKDLPRSKDRFNDQTEMIFFITYYEMIKDFKNAYESLYEYVIFKEKNKYGNPEENILKLRENNLKLLQQQRENNLKIRYKFKLKQKELNKLKWQNYFNLAIFVSLVIFLVIVILFQLNSKNKTKFFLRNLIKSIDEERSRISRDLHDDTLQSLGIIKAKLLLNYQKQNDEFINELIDDIDVAIRDARELTQTIHPVLLKKLGFNKALLELVDKLNVNNILKANLNNQINDKELNSAIQKEIYFIIKECVNNSIKHSKSTEVSIILSKLDHSNFRLTYSDNGSIQKKQLSSNLELQTIKERVSIINGYLNVKMSSEGFNLELKFNANLKQFINK